jgi:hypothetical protein
MADEKATQNKEERDGDSGGVNEKTGGNVIDASHYFKHLNMTNQYDQGGQKSQAVEVINPFLYGKISGQNKLFN